MVLGDSPSATEQQPHKRDVVAKRAVPEPVIFLSAWSAAQRCRVVGRLARVGGKASIEGGQLGNLSSQGSLRHPCSAVRASNRYRVAAQQGARAGARRGRVGAQFSPCSLRAHSEEQRAPGRAFRTYSNRKSPRYAEQQRVETQSLRSPSTEDERLVSRTLSRRLVMDVVTSSSIPACRASKTCTLSLSASSIKANGFLRGTQPQRAWALRAPTAALLCSTHAATP